MTVKRDVGKVIPIIEKYFTMTGLAMDQAGLQYLPTAVTKFETGIRKIKKLRLSTSGKKDIHLLIEAFEYARDSANDLMNGQSDAENRRKMRESFTEYQRRCEKLLK